LGFTITDLADDSTLLNSGIQTVLGTTASVFNFDFSSNTGLKITFLGDFFNVCAVPVPLISAVPVRCRSGEFRSEHSEGDDDGGWRGWV
jgi:hypothetical protein